MLLYSHILCVITSSFTHSEIDWTCVHVLGKLFAVLYGRYVFSSSKNQLQAVPMKIAIAGTDSYVGSVLQPYVELLSSKSPEWLNFLRFLIVPFST